MKQPTLKQICIALACASTAALSSNVQAEFAVTLRTTISDDSSTAATRLYNQGAPAGPGVDPSEAGDPVWLVFDVDGGGVFQPNALTGVSYDGTIGDLISKLIQPGDYVIQTTIPGPLEGRLSRNFPGLPSSLQTGGSGLNDAGGTVKPAVAILFDEGNLTNGGTFGFDQTVGGGLIPQTGNVDLRIGQDVYANSYTFSTGGTPPTQPTLSSATAQVSGANVVFNFTYLTQTATTSQIQSATDLTHPINWANEGAAIAGTGSTTNITVTTPISEAPQKFFRVKVE